MNFKDTINKCRYYDTHSHINSDPLLSQSDQIINECKNQDVMMNAIGTNEIDSLKGLELSNKYDNVFSVVGFHPECIDNHSPNECISLIEDVIKQDTNKKIIAIGEIGLDYVCSDVDHQIQKEVFINFIQLAKKYNLPIELHIREAHDDAIEILKNYASGVKKVVHCFNGNKTIAKKYLDLDCFFAINGIATFKKKNEELIEALSTTIPLEKLLLETDCPYLSPEPVRGTQNTPLNVIHIFKKISQIYNVSISKLEEHLKLNAISLFDK